MVFQEPRLLPWRTVEQNVRLAAPQASDASLDALFRTLGLAAHRDHYPGELSLGLARRVALARAFAVEPDLLLLDEPFVSLDDALAARLREELAELVNQPSGHHLLVTHDVDEAIGLADRLLLLSASPARVIAEVPVTRPRAAHTAEEIGGHARRDRAQDGLGPALLGLRPLNSARRRRAAKHAALRVVAEHRQQKEQHRRSAPRPAPRPARTCRRARSGSAPRHG